MIRDLYLWFVIFLHATAFTWGFYSCSYFFPFADADERTFMWLETEASWRHKWPFDCCHSRLHRQAYHRPGPTPSPGTPRGGRSAMRGGGVGINGTLRESSQNKVKLTSGHQGHYNTLLYRVYHPPFLNKIEGKEIPLRLCGHGVYLRHPHTVTQVDKYYHLTMSCSLGNCTQLVPLLLLLVPLKRWNMHTCTYFIGRHGALPNDLALCWKINWARGNCFPPPVFFFFFYWEPCAQDPDIVPMQ